MTTRKPEGAGPREPYNIPVRFYGADKSLKADPEYRALFRDIRILIEDGILRGVLPRVPRKKSKKGRRSKNPR